MDDVPTERDALMLDPTMVCDEHTEEAAEWDVPFLNLLFAAQGALLESKAFFDVAYKKKNGYDRPDGVEWDDVPESEQPGTEHINAAMREVKPICCWLEENVDDPFPDQPTPVMIGILAKAAKENLEDEADGDE